MFYSQFILAKKGPLGTIWIAAHLERKLRKNQVAETDIGVTVDSILFPEAPIALRLSGHLLLGVVRIYSRQVNYLFNDCSETLGKIKQAFHAAAVDLPPEATTAPFHAITLPETFDFDELELNAESDNSYLHANGNYVDQHVTTREQITLQDTVDHTPYLGSSQFGLDERFGDDGTQVNFALDFDEDFMENKAHPSAEDASTSISLLKEDIIPSSLTDENEAIVLSKNDIAGPSSVYDNEATPMDIDVPSEHVNPGFCEVDTVGDRGKALFDLGTSERDICSNACSHTISIDPLDDHRISQSSQKKDSEFLSSKHGLANLHASSPRILETRTPDLNQEYCPPDEPSTPALVGETSLPIYKETTTDNGGKSSPVLSGHSERETNSEILSGPQQPQINLSTSCTGANEVHESSQHHTASFPTSPTKVFRAASPAPFQVFTHCQTLPMEGNSGAISFETGTIEASSVKDNVTGGASIFSSCSEYTSLQQNKMVFSDESVSFRSLEQASLRQSGAALSQGLSIPLEASQSFSAPAAVLSQLKDSQISSVNGNVVVTSASISSIPQTTCSSQTITGLLQETQISLPQTSSVIDNVPISSVKEGATMAAMVTASSPRQSLAQENTGFLQNSSRLSSTSSPSFPAGVETIQLPSLKEDSAMEPSQQNRTCSSQETASILSHASHSVMSPSATSFPQDKIVPVSSVQESAAVMTKPLSDSFTCLEQRKFDSFQGSTFFTTDGQMVLQQSRAHFFQNADEVSTQSSGSLFQFREPTQYLENIWTPPLRENSVAASATLPSQTRVDLIQDADKISKRPFGSFLHSADSIHQPENIQASTFKENTAPSPVSLPHHSLGTSLQESNNRTLQESVNPSTSQGICLQQIRSSLSQEGTTIPTNALCSSLTSSTAFPLPQLEKVQAQYIKENAATTSTGFPILFQQTHLQQNSAHPLHASAPTVLQQSKLQQNSIGSSQTSAPTISQQSNLLLSQEGPNIPGKALDYSLASSSGKQNAPTTSMASPNSLHQARVQQNSTVSMQTSDATILQRNNLLLSQEGSSSRSSTTSLPEVQSIQTSSIEENTVMATKDIPNFIQQTYSQQNVTGSLQASANFPSPQQSIFLQKVTHLAQESADFTTNTSGSLTSSTKGPSTLLAASMPQHMDAHVTTISSDLSNIPQQACLQQNKTTPLQDKVDISAPQQLSFKKARIILPQDGDTSLTNTSGAMGASSVALMSQLNDAYVSPAMENRPPCPPQVCLQQSRTCLSEDTGRPLQASLHQSRMVLSHEGNDYSIDQSSSLCAPAASMPETGMNLYPFPKIQWGNNTNQVVSRPFPQQILADDQSTPKIAFQISTESSGFGLANYHHQSVTGRGLMPSLPSQTVVTSSFSTNSASSLIIGNVHPSGQMEHMNLDKSSAGTKGLHWQSVSQQLNPSLSTTMAPLMPSMCMEECETLRSSHHLQSRPSDFTLLQTNTSVNRTTASEVGRNRFYSPNFEEASKESLLSGSDKTPMWRDVSPSMSMRTSSMSTPNLDSRPRDDDVLGSILGPRDNIFKVILTPEAQKTSKADVATKKPKLISRATAKRRKVDLDVMAVLHGDVIRQQLANTEDIRRERRKAPCTRREVWSFLREHEGQDNCSEPTLPELSADIHELYHDVIHGRESKPHPLNGAAEVRGVSKARTGEESDLLAHYVMKISSKEMLSSEGVNRNGSHSLENQVVENASSVLLVDNSQPVSANNVQNISGVYFSEQLKEIPREDLSAHQSLSMGMLEANNMAQRTPLVDTSVKYSDELKGVPEKAMSVQENICDGLIEADNVEVFRPDELAISHAAIEVQAEKEGPTICFPDAHFTEATSTVAISGTRDIEHDAQAIHVEREIVNAEKLRLPELVEPELGVESLTKAEGQAITSPLIQVPQCTVTSSMGEARIEDQAVQITQLEKEHEMLEQVPEVTLTFGTNEIKSEEQGAQTIQLEEKHEVIEKVSEDTFILDMNETRNKEQDVQATHLEREQEVLEQVKMMSMIDNHSEIVHKEELNQDVIIMHRDRERENVNKYNQHVSDIHGHACHEGQLLLPSEAASLQSSAMPSAGKDSIDVPAVEDAKLDHGNTATNDVTALAEEKLSASSGVEEDVNIDRFDGEIVAMEIERGTDFDGADPDAYFAEEDNKLPYAEIDYSSDEQELSVKDDSGWSTRTRNVGKYLKTLFQEMGSSSKHMDEAPNLGLERLLSRRTRKEAARMFFETLVLKTKDYVHVVQDVPYHDVLIYPKSKLMKTEF